jgi:hypothetical protein
MVGGCFQCGLQPLVLVRPGPPYHIVFLKRGSDGSAHPLASLRTGRLLVVPFVVDAFGLPWPSHAVRIGYGVHSSGSICQRWAAVSARQRSSQTPVESPYMHKSAALCGLMFTVPSSSSAKVNF